MFREYAYQQAEVSECGLACLAACSAILGNRLDLPTLRRQFPVPRGMSLKDVQDVASAIGLAARSVRCELEDLGQLKLPAILHFGLNHFVVLERVSGQRIHVFDPAIGRRRVEGRELSDLFTGVAVEITATPTFQKRRQPAPLHLFSLFRWTPQLVGGIGQLFLLSILLEIYVLASPYYMELAIDQAALKGDGNLLISLSVGFGAFALFNVVAATLRALVLQRVSALLNWEMTVGLFRHLIRLPLPWFQRRQLADVLGRFQSLDPVKALIGNGLIAAGLDGLLSLATGAMLFIYAPLLASIVVASLAAYVAIRFVSIPVTRTQAARGVVSSFAEQGKRIETLRAIQTIKIMGGEAQRESDWANKFADFIRKSQATALTSIAFNTLHDFFNSAAHVAVIGLGAYEVIHGRLTVGMLYAFTAYQAQFLGKATSFVEQMFSWRMLDLYTFRLAEIALTPQEAGIHRTPAGLPDMVGKIEVKGASFRYSTTDKFVFEKVDLTIEPGEFVAVVGPSGCGKSTFLKVLTGLYPLSNGSISIDGVSISDWGPRVLRRSLGVVMQDDELLSGTIVENVTFFDEATDMDRVWECLALAAVDDDVRKMPMRTDTFVGELGSILSGGQKQRILLARALYRRPKILVLDEATSHLDLKREEAINRSLKSLSITRIIIAHRPETIAAADRVVSLDAKRERASAVAGRRASLPRAPRSRRSARPAPLLAHDIVVEDR